MNNLSSDSLIERHTITPGSTTKQTTLVFVAWASTLLLSKLPLVIARDILGTDIPWITSAWIGIAVLLFAATYVWSALKPLRSYFIMMAVIVLMVFWLDPSVRETEAWRNLFSSQSQMITLLGERILLLLESFVVVSALFLIGTKRQEAFLVIGNLNAPVGGNPNSSERRKLSWLVFGTGMAILLGGLFSLFMASQFTEGGVNFSAVSPWLPLILLSAALNAFGEEVMFRAAPLATLLKVIGPTHVLWLTSLWFGLGHYYGGIPSGPFGLIQAGLLALLLGKAMLDTRGMGWSWMIHVVLDTVIYISIAMTIS